MMTGFTKVCLYLQSEYHSMIKFLIYVFHYKLCHITGVFSSDNKCDLYYRAYIYDDQL